MAFIMFFTVLLCALVWKSKVNIPIIALPVDFKCSSLAKSQELEKMEKNFKILACSTLKEAHLSHFS